jgi:putative oxidoreductase
MAQSLSERFFDPLVNNDAVAGPVLLVARILMSGAFLVFGIGKIIHMARMQDYMEAHGVPGDLIPIAIVVQIGFGLLVVLGYQTRFAAMMLAGFCIIATSLFHTQFSATGELAHFTKDFSIAGGFLFMIAYGPGPLSLDARIARARASGRERLTGERQKLLERNARGR